MAENKVTWVAVASSALEALRCQETCNKTKTASAGALSQTHEPTKPVSATSRVPREGRTSKESKLAVGSALSQRSKTEK